MQFRLIGLCIGLLVLPIAARSQSLQPQTTWVNDHARFVIQSIDADGKLSGTYENIGANFSCAGQAFPVTGWVDGERISYAVRRKSPGNCTSIEAWTGYIRGGELLVEFYAVLWDGTQDVVLKGTDRYRKQSFMGRQPATGGLETSLVSLCSGARGRQERMRLTQARASHADRTHAVI